MTTQFTDCEPAPAALRVRDTLYRFGIAGLGACVATQRETHWIIQTLVDQSRHLQAAVLDNVAQRTIIAENWVDHLDHAMAAWRTQVEQLSRLQFERFLHQCGLATHEDLRALVRKLDDVNLCVADMSEDLEKTA